MNEETFKLIDEYHQTFGEWFPTFAVGNSENEIVKQIEISLKTGKKYNVDLPDEALY